MCVNQIKLTFRARFETIKKRRYTFEILQYPLLKGVLLLKSERSASKQQQNVARFESNFNAVFRNFFAVFVKSARSVLKQQQTVAEKGNFLTLTLFSATSLLSSLTTLLPL